MNSTEAQEPSEEELDLLQHGHEAAGTGLSEDAADTIAFTTEGKDLLADADLRGIMAQFNPAASKDILAIEKGVENFFLFHQAPHALARPQQMEHLGPRELQVLEERDTFVRFAFIACAEESGQLFTQEVLIRPSSLKADQVAKVKNACVRASATSIAQYIDLRDRQLQQMERSDELGKWVSARFMQSGGDGETIRATSQKDVHQLMLSLHNLSFEAFLENEIKAPEELIIPVMALLKRPADFILSELQIGPTIPDAARAVLETRARLPLLIALSADFHLIQPPAGHLIEMDDGQVKEHRSELEWIYVLHVQMARRILFILLPEEETGWIQTRGTAQDKRYLEELRKHPSFTAGESWQGGVEFLTCYEALLKIVRQTRAIRREYLIELVTEDTVKKLNMQFEPVLFSPESFEIPDPNIESYIKREELYEHVIERMKKMSDVFSYEERR
ncbi:MAG: hypothetical protein KDK27_16185, partial [Leptospiraceae bacterium]|nr:hypothetical protein [Leptospiraceae bacterium]